MSKRLRVNGGVVAFVSACDFVRLSQFKWYRQSNGYVVRVETRVRNGKRRSILLHRDIMRPPANRYVDHINGERLDNRRENLRVVTSRVNAQNRKIVNPNGAHGVYWRERRQRWEACIVLRGKWCSLGSFTDLADAVAKRRMVEAKHGFMARAA